jgi:hypothetical protein
VQSRNNVADKVPPLIKHCTVRVRSGLMFDVIREDVKLDPKDSDSEPTGPAMDMLEDVVTVVPESWVGGEYHAPKKNH